MESVSSDILAYTHYGLILALTSAQMLIVYFLSDSSNPPRGLGLFTVYFMASLMSWILFTLQHTQGAQASGLDVPAIAVLSTSYLLFLAASQRADWRRGRWLLGAVCLGACLSAFYLPAPAMFNVEVAGIILFWSAAGAVSAWRGWRWRNVGDGLIGCAGLVMLVGLASTWLHWQNHEQLQRAQLIAMGIHSAAYALVVVGFLASVLLEYQQHLSHLATEDPLTRLLNRRGLQDAVYVSLASAARQRSPTSAIMLDIDHFKQVNDSFGHDTGDRVLQQIAVILQRMSRASDVVSRFGGEEFLLILPDTPAEAARALAERIRASIAAEALLVDGQRIAITVSLGVTTIAGETDLDQLASEADQAMYQAKRAGRNRVATLDTRTHHFRSGDQAGIAQA